MPLPGLGGVVTDVLDETNFSALTTTPLPDVTYNNVVLRIDPSYNALGRGFIGNGTGLQMVINVFNDMMDDGLSETAAPNYATIEPLGRAEAFKTFMGTNSKEIPMIWRFVAHRDNSIGEEVIRPVRFLESLKYPVPGGPHGLSYAPPPCLLTIGKLLAARVIVSEANVRWQGPFEPGTMMPHGAEVQCVFTVVRALPIYTSEEHNYSNFETGSSYNDWLTFPSSGVVQDQGGQPPTN